MDAGTPCDMACAHIQACSGLTCAQLGVDCSTVGSQFDCEAKCVTATPCAQLGQQSIQACQAQCSPPPPPVYCGQPGDCAGSAFCASNGTCQPGPCSASAPCVGGYTCVAGGTCQSGTPNACVTDGDCTNGRLCLAGSDGKGSACAEPCFDQAQCGAGELCVAGKCTLGCKSNTDCRDGFNCDTTKGVCSLPATSCTITNDCGSATQVCVTGACVPRSNGGTCTNPGDVWRGNGCIPNQAPTFVCQNDGVRDACAAGSICLHHDCWISCDAPSQNACVSQTILNTCKPMTDNGMSYNVCGTPQNLGNQCGAGAGNQTCSAGKVCIDGFCK